MPKALTIVRDDYTSAELREAAIHGNDADATRRMLALALVLEGYKRGETGELCGMDDWVLRYNAEGIVGLCNRIAAGPKPRLTSEQEATVAELVRKGPDLAKHGVVRSRRVDLARVIKTRFNVTLAERRSRPRPNRSARQPRRHEINGLLRFPAAVPDMKGQIQTFTNGWTSLRQRWRRSSRP